MKVISLKEAQSRLPHYAKLCKTEEVIVRVAKKNSFQLVPSLDDDVFIDELIASNAEFRRDMTQRRAENKGGKKRYSSDELLKDLERRQKKSKS